MSTYMAAQNTLSLASAMTIFSNSLRNSATLASEMVDKGYVSSPETKECTKNTVTASNASLATIQKHNKCSASHLRINLKNPSSL